ncbi:hypothetical protein [Agromyces aureus]|uniref:Uncharacterized protein n=1 Tax=Agromyces aureus TaxID=453304 RepID=A0A191WIR3_9MICO|nr:hypothetical protein [Agromyces aureus]ANJ28107.1 hypothetical protein ATC03_16700 [Agromyces aureus]
MAGFLVRRRLAARELQAHDAELAKRAASALLAVDEGIRAASEEVCFAEAEMGADAIDGAWAVIAVVRRHLSDAFRLNRLNHDAMPGTPDVVRARSELIVRVCEWAEHVLGELTSTLADRVAQGRRAPVVVAVTEVRVAQNGVAQTRTLQARTDAAGSPPTLVIAEAHAHLIRLRAARSALDAATTAAGQGTTGTGRATQVARATRAARATPPRPLATSLQRAIEAADRTLDLARSTVAEHRGRIGAEALTRLAEAEHLRIDLRHGLGAAQSTASLLIREDHRTLATTIAQHIATLASDAVLLARRDLAASRPPSRRGEG